jgi:hypothetical protein
MATRKGQHLRILLLDGDKFKVVGKSTNATITLTGNSDDVSTKDDVILFSKPEITSKSWSVQVESLDVTDTAAVLNAIKNLKLFTLIWDEVDTGDNQTMMHAGFARTGTAYLNDVTFQWDDRTNSTKQLQFTGVGALQKITTKPTQDLVEKDDAYTKGQFVRLFLGSDNSAVPAKIVAAAKSLSLHVSLSLESATTKDTEGDWEVQEPTALSFDISSNALVKSGETITSTVPGINYADIEDAYEAATPIPFQIANVSGANNRTKGTVICSGLVVITQLELSAQNMTSASYTTTLTGYGIYTVAA